MLKNHLNTVPYSKLVIIQDSLRLKGAQFLDYIVNTHGKNQETINYYVFNGKLNKNPRDNVKYHDFTTNPRGWFSDKKKGTFPLKTDGVLVIDSLAHVIVEYGLAETYRILQQFKNSTDVKRIVTLLHSDVLEDPERVLSYLKHLASFYIRLEPRETGLSRAVYIYKKTSGKIVKEVEEYYFEDKELIVQPINKKEIVEEKVNELLPEDLTTFKISLGEKDKELRDKLVLPFLPKENSEIDSEQGTISYQFDNVDDWDEEDPDDDLDI